MSVSELKPRPKNAEPWKKKSTNTKLTLALVSTLPLLFTLYVIFGLGVDGTIATVLIFLPLQFLATGYAGWKVSRKAGIQDAALFVSVIFLTVLVLVLLLSVVWSVISAGSAIMSWSFISQNNIYISAYTSKDYGGVGHAILGTLGIVAMTTIVAVPLGLAIAVFLTETRSKLRGPVRILIQAMSGLPSVVAGLFIYSALIASGFMQYSMNAGALALIPLMLPTVARVSEEALRLVPVELRNGALALGASSYKAFFQVTLPAALSGIITALLLGIARVIGETAPLLLTIGASNGTVLDPSSPSASLPTYIYGYLLLGEDVAIQRAWGAALTVLILVALIFTAARIAGRPNFKLKRKAKK